jgi:hypothetical protein
MAMITILVLRAQKVRAPHYSIPIVIALLHGDKRDASIFPSCQTGRPALTCRDEPGLQSRPVPPRRCHRAVNLPVVSLAMAPKTIQPYPGNFNNRRARPFFCRDLFSFSRFLLYLLFKPPRNPECHR